MGDKEGALLLLLQCSFMILPAMEGVKIAAYNVRVFGVSKLQNQVAMDMITQIVRQYDIIVIQEVRGVNADVPNEVLNRVNQAGNDYAICNSVYRFKPASGTHREMYLYLYRTATVRCVQYDEAEDVNANFAGAFRRPPTVARFQTLIGSEDFFIIGIHTQPSRAKTEINSLVDVYNTFKLRYQLDNGFIMGDFNYGGSYVPSSDLDMLNIDNSPFLRYINKTDGTTVKPFDPTPGKRPYDRIYVAPQSQHSFITAVGIDKFRDMLDEPTYYKTVSDHYPVYVDVAIGGSGGTNPQSFLVTTDELYVALKEECTAVIGDYDPMLDDDLEMDFYNFCTHCSLTQTRRLSEELAEECQFTGNGGVSFASMSIFKMVMLLVFIGICI